MKSVISCFYEVFTGKLTILETLEHLDLNISFRKIVNISSSQKRDWLVKFWDSVNKGFFEF